MKIKTAIYYQILDNCPCTPVEVGGIIGADDEVINHFAIDEDGFEYGRYSPNTEYLNQIISEWENKGISFWGIYHSHYPSGEKLSNADVEYIKAIMLSVGDYYKELYFPVVIPKKKIFSYKAKLNDGVVIISNDQICLID